MGSQSIEQDNPDLDHTKHQLDLMEAKDSAETRGNATLLHTEHNPAGTGDGLNRTLSTPPHERDTHGSAVNGKINHGTGLQEMEYNSATEHNGHVPENASVAKLEDPTNAVIEKNNHRTEKSKMEDQPSIQQNGHIPEETSVAKTEDPTDSEQKIDKKTLKGIIKSGSYKSNMADKKDLNPRLMSAAVKKPEMPTHTPDLESKKHSMKFRTISAIREEGLSDLQPTPELDPAIFHSGALRAIDLAQNYAFQIQQPDGHWFGEQKGNITITSEYVFLYQLLGLTHSLDRDREVLIRYILSEQGADGSWTLAPDDIPGDVSCTTEAYLALKILGLEPDSAPMVTARSRIHALGGAAKVRVFTRFYLACFGLWPWSSVPEMPCEILWMPNWSPVSIYRLSSWARCIIVPLLLLSHHRPIFALPNGKSAHNDYLDELWLNPARKDIPYCKPLLDLFLTDFTAFGFAAADTALWYLGGLRRSPLRGFARKAVVEWILGHQEVEGDIGGIYPGAHFCVVALICEGYSLEDKPVVKFLEAIERFGYQDDLGKRIQPCVGPVWDTILMSMAICDTGLEITDHRLKKAIEWVKARQLFGPEGDWRIYSPNLAPGGFSFEYFNTWYPDIDDTAAAIIAFVKQSPASANTQTITAAVEWILGMQNRDDGWGAFDKDNDYLFLNKIPFSDMEALCDPSSPDVTGRILEAFGLLMRTPDFTENHQELLKRVKKATDRGIDYIIKSQEETGAWFGRWGSNYIYGTSNVLCGLAYHTKSHPFIKSLIPQALGFLKEHQNPDGGWGETLETYRDPSLAGRGVSTPTHTAWALIGLMTQVSKTDAAIEKGVSYLLETQSDKAEEGATWPQRLYTGTGFPNHWYLGYTLYPHFFPMMALGRYVGGDRSKRNQLDAVTSI